MSRTQLHTLRITLNEVAKLLADAERCAQTDDALSQLLGGLVKAADSVRWHVEERLHIVTVIRPKAWPAS